MLLAARPLVRIFLALSPDSFVFCLYYYVINIFLNAFLFLGNPVLARSEMQLQFEVAVDIFNLLGLVGVKVFVANINLKLVNVVMLSVV